MLHRLMLFFLTLSLLAPKPGYPLDASPHQQLVVSVTDSWNDFHATLYLFQQKEGRWVRRGKGLPAVVGRNGLAWDPAVPDRDPAQPVKREGDGKAPAGLFPLSRSMGFSPFPPAGSALPYRGIQQGTHCVDDRSSPYYNRIVAEKEVPGAPEELWRSSERMWEFPDLYRLLVVVDYNVRAPKQGDGSCIFMHIWRSGTDATSGCTALAEGDLAAVVEWLKPEANPALVQLPREAFSHVWRQWRLPSPQLLEDDEGKRGAPLVDVRSVAPDVMVEMRYGMRDNFTGRVIYECGRCFLKPHTADKIARAERELRQAGLSLKLWDCYRPVSAQKLLWSLVPDPRFVADPKRGSRHNRGTAVDVTLVDAAGRELEMPTRFDDFSPRASHGESRLPPHILENRRTLAKAMEKAGFRRLQAEWWHYDDTDSGGDILDVSFGELCR